MGSLNRWQRFTAVFVGAAAGTGVYLYLKRSKETPVFTSWTTNTIVPKESKWDFNWDQ